MRRYTARNPAETELLRATLAVYRELRADGRTPKAAWQRIDGLTDEVLVGPVMADEAPTPAEEVTA